MPDSNNNSTCEKYAGIYKTSHPQNRTPSARYNTLRIGAPIIEACHINSHANEGDNRIQNGIALCRNLHTAFDYGLIGLDDQYRILVKSKKTFQESTEHYYALAGLKGKSMLLPNNKMYYPSLENLRQHREINGF